MRMLSSFLTLSLFTLLASLPLVMLNPSQESNSVTISNENIVLLEDIENTNIGD